MQHVIVGRSHECPLILQCGVVGVLEHGLRLHRKPQHLLAMIQLIREWSFLKTTQHLGREPRAVISGQCQLPLAFGFGGDINLSWLHSTGAEVLCDLKENCSREDVARERCHVHVFVDEIAADDSV